MRKVNLSTAVLSFKKQGACNQAGPVVSKPNVAALEKVVVQHGVDPKYRRGRRAPPDVSAQRIQLQAREQWAASPPETL